MINYVNFRLPNRDVKISLRVLQNNYAKSRGLCAMSPNKIVL